MVGIGYYRQRTGLAELVPPKDPHLPPAGCHTRHKPHFTECFGVSGCHAGCHTGVAEAEFVTTAKYANHAKGIERLTAELTSQVRHDSGARWTTIAGAMGGR